MIKNNNVVNNNNEFANNIQSEKSLNYKCFIWENRKNRGLVSPMKKFNLCSGYMSGSNVKIK